MSKAIENEINARLTVVREQLSEVRLILVEENKDGKQMDYVSNPNMSNVVDEVEKEVAKISDIIYQKSK